jgi:hypothetical protein
MNLIVAVMLAFGIPDLATVPESLIQVPGGVFDRVGALVFAAIAGIGVIVVWLAKKL